MQHIAIIAAKTADSRERSELIIFWRAARGSREDRKRSAISLWS